MTSVREIHLNSIMEDLEGEMDKVIGKFCNDPLYKLSPLQADLLAELLMLYKDQVDTMFELSYARLTQEDAA